MIPLVLMTATASAISYDVRFCFKWDIDFDDASPGHDDYYANNSIDEPARGVYYEVRYADSHSLATYGYAEDVAHPGCTPVLALYGTYDVTVFSQTRVNGGNTVQVFDDTATPALYADLIFDNAVIVADGTLTHTTNVVGDWVNVIAAATTTIFRHNGGMTDQWYTVFDDGWGSLCSSGGSGSLNACGYVFIGLWSQPLKYVISHELGHNMARLAIGGTKENSSYGTLGATDETEECDYDDVSHSMVSVEFQSAAAAEGLAHFIAATTFNDATATTADCWIDYWKPVDWDGDLDIDGGVLPHWADCEGNDHCDNVGEVCGPIPEADHYGNVCNCLLDANRGVEFDWLRMFWDLRTNSTVPFADILGIWDEANPNTWSATDAQPDRLPTDRLRGAVHSYASGVYESPWNDWNETHGTDR